MAKLLSVNVGLPRDIEWQGRVVRTAIWKDSVPHRVFARRLNLDGDGQADIHGHGGEQRAVMVYQIEAYRYWERALGRTGFEYGQFGENFTVEGLADDEVCIGDRYRIGGAVFEVSQPRVTCYRLGIRMNHPQMAALVVSHRKPGFYLRVITEGEVGAGDEIEKIAEAAEKISVADVDGLLYTANHDLERIAAATRIPALSRGWKESFRAILEADKHGTHSGNPGLTSSTAPPPAWDGFRPVRIAEVHRETADVASFLLSNLDASALPHPLPGQFLVLRCVAENGSQPILRSYSISGSASDGVYRISVKRGSGPGSRHLVDSVRAGEKIEISAPRGDFVLRENDRPVVLLSAGIGVTPVLAMLHALAAASPASPREVWWIHAARNAGEHAFREESRELLAKIPGSRSAIAYSRPGPMERQGIDFDRQGRWDQESLAKLAFPLNADFYICGPSAFLEDVIRALTSMSVPQSAIHQEVFGSEGAIQPGVTHHAQKAPHPLLPAGDGPPVTFTRSGLAVPWDPRFQSLLEFAEACDIPVRWSCRTGVCHTCECGILDGQLRYAPEPLDRPAKGNALICCATPVSAVQLDL